MGRLHGSALRYVLFSVVELTSHAQTYNDIQSLFIRDNFPRDLAFSSSASSFGVLRALIVYRLLRISFGPSIAQSLFFPSDR